MAQQVALWKRVASVIKKLLKKHNELLISTHGHVIHYLHIRITPVV